MTYEELVLKHNELLVHIEQEDTAHDTRMKPFRDGVKAILAELLKRLQTDKLKNVKTDYGLVYQHQSVSVKVDNRDAFLQHVTSTGAWDMLDARALKDPVKEYLDSHDGVAPPGVKVEGAVSARIRGKQLETDK